MEVKRELEFRLAYFWMWWEFESEHYLFRPCLGWYEVV